MNKIINKITGTLTLMTFALCANAQDVGITLTNTIMDDIYQVGDVIDEQCYSIQAPNGSDLIGYPDLEFQLCTSKIVDASVVITVQSLSGNLNPVFIQDSFAPECWRATLGDDGGANQDDLVPFTNTEVCWTGEISDPSVPDNNNTIGGKLEITNSSSTDQTLTNEFDEQYVSTIETLPIYLHEFTATKGADNQSVILDWDTEAEINGSHFEVERSINNSEWTKIGTVEAVGESSILQTYSLIDSDLPLSARSQEKVFYYRLKMVDNDGTFEYSGIRSARFDTEDSVFLVYPNPTVNEIFVNLSGVDADNAAVLEIYNINGQKVMNVPVTTSNETRIDVSDLEGGAYILEATHGEEKFIQRILKID